jgi:hypothetical protein
MTRRLVFWLLSVPGFALGCLGVWALSVSSAWTPGEPELSLAVRLAIAASNWVVRLAPFAIIFLMPLWPLVVLGIARVTRGSRETTTHRDVLIWWTTSLAILLAIMGASALSFYMDVDLGSLLTIVMCLLWPAVIAFWVSLAAAYDVQHRRYLARETTLNPNWLLAALAAISVVGLFIVPLLAALALRPDTTPGRRVAEVGPV